MRIGKFPANGWMKCSGVVSGVKTCQDQLSWNFGRGTWETRRFARYKKGSHGILMQTSNTENAVFVPRQVYNLEATSFGTYINDARNLSTKKHSETGISIHQPRRFLQIWNINLYENHPGNPDQDLQKRSMHCNGGLLRQMTLDMMKQVVKNGKGGRSASSWRHLTLCSSRQLMRLCKFANASLRSWRKGQIVCCRCHLISDYIL